MAEKDICFICHEKIEGVEENKFDYEMMIDNCLNNMENIKIFA